MTRKILFPLSAAIALILASQAQAGSDSGFYIGGSIGQASLDYSDSDPDFEDVDFEDDDTGYKVFGGYNFGLLPLVDVAAEVAYVDFGSMEDDISGTTVKLDSSALTAAGVVGLKLGLFGLFGKVGVVNWDTDVRAFGFDDSESGTDPYYGIGAKIQLGSLAVRGEYEIFELDNVDVDYFSVGASITF